MFTNRHIQTRRKTNISAFTYFYIYTCLYRSTFEYIHIIPNLRSKPQPIYTLHLIKHIMNLEAEAVENLGVEEILKVLLTRYKKLDERIKVLKVELADQKTKLSDFENERGKDRQEISALRLALQTKEGGQRDFDLLTVDLLKAVSKRERGMDYKEVRGLFDFKSNIEAYRIMERTVEKFPLEVKIKGVKYGKKTKKVIFYVG